MHKYKITFQYKDGSEGNEYVYAVNRMMAFDVFGAFGYEDVVNVDVFRVTDEDEEGDS